MSRIGSMDFYGQEGAKFTQLFGAYKRQVIAGNPGFPLQFTLRGPDTIEHKLRVAPRSGDPWTPLPLSGGQRYRLDSVSYIGANAVAIFVPNESSLTKQFGHMRMNVSDAIVQLDGFEEFVETMLEWGEGGVMEQIERAKTAAINAEHQAAVQRARECSKEASEIYGEEWGAF